MRRWGWLFAVVPLALAAGCGDDEKPAPVSCRIGGRADDGDGVEAMVVEIDGTTDRPDGSTYHITWSLDRAKGRRAGESNDVIRDLGWTSFADPVDVSVIPARFSSG